MITIQELLYNRGLDKKSKIKLVRHKEKGLDLYGMYRQEKTNFLTYQSQQEKNIFDGVNYIVSFIGEKGTLARFIGIYRVTKRTKLIQKAQSVDGRLYTYNYEMEEVNGYDDLIERVIINWGKGALSWHQWIKNEKEVIEIHPGLHYKQFKDYFDFILSFKELTEIIKNQYSDWQKVLSVTKGIYLISDAKSGKLYVGAAYGEKGIWGRWSNYVSTGGHGGNKTLKTLLKHDNKYSENFNFSILMLLPKTITPDQAIEKEQLFKRKLGTNSFGLNNN